MSRRLRADNSYLVTLAAAQGYYNGKRGNTVIEVGSMQNNVHALERYCRKNHEMPVMDAAKNALGAEK